MSRSVLEDNIARLLKHARHPLTSEDVEASLARFRQRQAGHPRRGGRLLTAVAAAAFLALIVGVVLYRADGPPPGPGALQEKNREAYLDTLVAELGSGKPEVREKTAARLMIVGESALDALDRAVSGSDPALRPRAKKVADDIRRTLKPDSEKLGDEERKRRVDACATNLRHLWMLQMTYMSQFGGKVKKMPSETGPDFWLALTVTVPPLIDATQLEVLVCPGSGEKPRAGFTNFRGPRTDVRNVISGGPIGSCEPGSHPDQKINVLLKTGEMRYVGPEDELYKRVLENTVGAKPK